jgi:phosphoglycolate phosphatase-like HAD superfamily hydrolase
MTLALFDIDGTLLSSNGQAGRMLLEALEAVFGKIEFPLEYSFAGKTDPRICRDLMVASGFDEEQIDRGLGEVQDRYFRRVCNGALERERMTLFAGAVALVRELAATDTVDVGLVTGNWERSGRAKLACVGIEHYFGFGGFGDDGADRRRLPPAALARATARTGRQYRPEEVVVIGDTLHDIDCAHANGMRVLAVSTGSTPFDALQQAGADAVVEDLAEVLGGRFLDLF